jgi:hypothetical protein
MFSIWRLYLDKIVVRKANHAVLWNSDIHKNTNKVEVREVEKRCFKKNHCYLLMSANKQKNSYGSFVLLYTHLTKLNTQTDQYSI